MGGTIRTGTQERIRKLYSMLALLLVIALAGGLIYRYLMLQSNRPAAGYVERMRQRSALLQPVAPDSWIEPLPGDRVRVLNADSLERCPEGRGRHFACSPGLELEDHQGYFMVTMNVQGLRPTAVRVRIENQTLKVTGTNDQAGRKKNMNGQSFMDARDQGSFTTELQLPEPVQADKMKTELIHNVLVTTIPKAVSPPDIASPAA